MDELKEKTAKLANDLVYELNKSLGFKKDGFLEQIIRPLVWKPMFRFSELATFFDYQVLNEGFQRSSAWFISHFVNRVKTFGLENFPTEGPLVIASNHPGAYDSLVITANLPRDDVKIISSDIPFIKRLPQTRKHVIFAPLDAYIRMSVARKAIKHLENGGALLVFARGTMDPDPALLPGSKAEISHWTSSLGLFLNKVPQTRLNITMVSNVLSKRYIKHPATLFRKGSVNKQRLSEFFQVMYQLAAPGKLMVSPNLSVGAALTLDELGNTRDFHQITQEIIRRAKHHFDQHCRQMSLPACVSPG